MAAEYTGRGRWLAGRSVSAILAPMIYSMTGFARAETRGDWGQLAWELRTVNHRYQDISFRLPDVLRATEPALRERIGQRVRRGKCEVTCRLDTAAATAAASLSIDTARLDAVAQAVRTVADHLDTATPDPLRVLGWPGVVVTREVDTDTVQAAALAALDEALDALVEARSREGAALAALLLDRADAIDAFVADLRGRLPQLHEEWKTRLRERLAEFQTELEPGRLEQEFLLLANRADVAEELDRLTTHTHEIRQILQRTEPVGRRLDFLIQELNREANTLGSKSQDSTVTAIAVELKVAIEQMREQVQNIE